MSAPASSETAGAVAAMQATVAALADAGVQATTDAGAFYPQPIGVLVGLPSLVERGLASSTYSVPVSVVSGDPLNEELPVQRLFALADDCARAVRTDQYRPGSWSGSVNVEPLPAIEMAAVVTLETLGGGA